MKLEVGKRYKDQFNNVFTIISDQAKAPYNYIGQSTKGELIGFTYEGRMTYCDGRLVEEVREPQKFETIRYAVTNNIDKCVANMVGYSTAKRVHPEQVKVRITVEEVEE